MREILFRGKRTDNNEWVKGALSHGIDGTLNQIEVFNGYCCVDIQEVDPSTVGQYTGLTDRNGKRIFEGDILVFQQAIDESEPLEVIFDCLGWRVKPKGDSGEFMDDDDGKCATIIGNVHDNQELLEGEV